MRLKNVTIITNIPSPYRVDFFAYLQENISSLHFNIIYTSLNEDNRQWKVDTSKMKNSIILHSKMIKIKGKEDSRYIHFSSMLLKKLNELKPDIVIAFEYNPAALQSLLWCKRKRIKFIHLTDGTLYSERQISLIQKLCRKIIISGADAFLASSTRAKEKLLKWGADEKKIFLAMLTVDIGAYMRQPRKPVQGRILYVGSAVHRKGLDLLIDSLSYVALDYHLHIVGNVTVKEKKEIERIAREKGVQQRIIWRGFKQDEMLRTEYSEAKVFVLPSRQDCFGLVLLEAAASRVPIVSSKYADGVYDIVMSDAQGEIVDPYEPKNMARAITRYLKCDNTNIDIAYLNKFSFEAVASRYLDAINEVMKEK